MRHPSSTMKRDIRSRPGLKNIFLGSLSFFVGAITMAQGVVHLQPTEFAGTHLEDWESYRRSDILGVSGLKLPVLGGLGTITGSYEFIWLTQFGVADPNTGGFGLGGFAARAHDGLQGYGTSLERGTTSLQLTTPVLGFGGYWASALPARPIEFTFFDEQGKVLASDSVTYSAPNNNGTLEWFGWTFDAPVSRVDYEGSWVVNDSLRAIAVPEPSILALFAIGGGMLALLHPGRAKSGPQIPLA